MMEATNSYAQRLRLADRLRKPAIRSALDALKLPEGSRGLDAGCGIGRHTALLAEATGPRGHITGLDVSADFLGLAEEHARSWGLSSRVSFRHGDINALPFEDCTFDWAWSADTVYAGPVGDPIAITRELARVVRPGGQVAILFWSAQKLLPGYPLLEARLDAVFAQTAPYLLDIAPELQSMNALGWLHRAGLMDCSAYTFAVNIHAPLAEETRAALAMTFEMLWADARSGLADEDQALFARLCEPQSAACILNRPDYCGFLTYSLFTGRVPG
jgi:ubiquinone/menaquinone biosynthesis C-methylase UbiE